MITKARKIIKYLMNHKLETMAYIIILAVSFVVVIPFFWMLSTSFKEAAEVFRVPIEWIPRTLNWENYPEAMTRRNFGVYFYNSVIVSVTVTTIHLLLASLAGFSLAKYEYFGKRIIFIGILATFMIPFQVVMIPMFLLVRDLGLLDSLTGIIAPQVLTAFGVFLIRQHLLTIPDSLLEAARMDGASEFYIYKSIIIPLSKPVLAVLAIFVFRSSWDNLLWPLIVVSQDSLRTLPLGLNMFIAEYDIQENLMMAASVIASLPIFAIFVFAQKYFTRGISLSGMKG